MNGPAVHFGICGQAGASRFTRRADEVTCARCLLLLAGRWVTTGLTWAERPHGTLAAYRRHLRRRETACEACLQAGRRDWEDRAGQADEKRRAGRAA